MIETDSTDISLELQCFPGDLSRVQILHRQKLIEKLFALQELIATTKFQPTNLSSINGSSNNVPKNKKRISTQIDTAVPEATTILDSNPAPPPKRLRKEQVPLPKAPQLPKASELPKASQPKSNKAAVRTSSTLKATPPLQPKVKPIQPKTAALQQKAASVTATISDDDDIEVIEETSTIKPKTGPSFKSVGSGNATPKVAQQPVVKSTVMKKLPVKANNVLLLNVIVKPRNVALHTTNSTKRRELDGKVKVILMKSSPEFIEWLLKNGYIRATQLCSVHRTAQNAPIKLKLGYFPDPKVLVTSGGYVWLSECCGRKYISVYSGSIFATSLIEKVPPTSVLKLIYHWSCQTSVANIESWVKVPKTFVAKIYNYLRCICSIILHDKIFDFGSDGSAIELGIVSLGTTTSDGSKKSVKVEILGLYDRKKCSYRLFASTPEPSSTSRARFMRILKPMKEVVHKNARIICDQSVDPTCLHSLGFSSVEICYSSENEHDRSTNSIIMYYLRKHVPRMFQATLSQLTEHQVQLALDELCWREKFAYTSGDCYDNIMSDVAYLTLREVENPGLIPLLEFVSEHCNNNFRYKTNLSQIRMGQTIPTAVPLTPTCGPIQVAPTQYEQTKCLVLSNKILIDKMRTSKQQKDMKLPIFETTQQTQQLLNSAPISAPFTVLTTSVPRVAKSTALDPRSIAKAIEVDKQLTQTLMAQKKNLEMKSLENYYYGRIEGNPLLGQEYSNYTFKCHMCFEYIENNVLFYAHLKCHLAKTDTNIDLNLMCEFCNRYFEVDSALESHKSTVHLMDEQKSLWCRICAEKSSQENYLKVHMSRKHVECEIPYRCEVCHYATSFYFEIIKHFNTKHKGTPYVQCHHCLTVKALNPASQGSFSSRFYQHMQKHTHKMNCKSCLLSFYSKYLLNEHKKEHLSCVNVDGVKRYEPSADSKVIYFKPIINTYAAVNLAKEVLTKNNAALSITETSYENIDIGLLEKEIDYLCAECDEPLAYEGHFPTARKCTKCVYTTCCRNMIIQHHQVFHPASGHKKATFSVGKPILLKETAYCPCGFNTRSGNHIARHLSLCSQSALKIAYPTKACEPDTRPESRLEGEVSFDELNLEDLATHLLATCDESASEAMDFDDAALPDLPVLPLSVEIQED